MLVGKSDTDNTKTNNWGRWGADDQRGTLNLITGEKVRESSALVRTGRVITLGRQIRHGMLHAQDRTGPTYVLTVDAGDYATGARTFGRAKVADDFLSFSPGLGTHLDGLAHVWEGDELYNRHSANGVRSRGAKRLGIHNVGGVVTRGVLLDVAGLHGGALPPSHHITVDEIEACAQKVGGVRAGDAVLVRTAWLVDETRDRKEMEELSPGIGIESGRWLAERDVALVGADNFGVEAFPVADADAYIPVHLLMLRECGIHLLELVDLEELAEAGATEFQFVMAPLKIRGGINSPVNPLAVL
jgi:kynurenine formamidase